ncbi:MAG: hypothetical protein J6J42_08400 [Lachnospiraceae bacterium]|nr:hypothetical protein [Lachnospiraceae bacterium]
MKENSGNEYSRQTFAEFREDYKGFDWENGEIVFIQKNNAAHTLIWNYGGPWEVMAAAHFDKPIIHWKHTAAVMVITLDF